MTNNFSLSQDQFINSGFYGDVYQLNSTKVVKLFRKTQLWTESDHSNSDDSDLIRKAHHAVETWMLSEALKWNADFFPKYYGKLQNYLFTDNPELKNNYVLGCSLIIEKLKGKELIYSEVYQVDLKLKISMILDHLEEISKIIWDFGRVSPHDCAIFIDDNKNIKITDIGGWNDRKYTDYYQIYGNLSEELRQELYKLINKIDIEH